MITETNKKTIQDGEHYYTVPRWKYILNWWTPIATLIMVGIAMLAWFNNADGRMFTDQKTKVLTETHIYSTENVEKKLDEYVKKEDFDKRIQEFLDLSKSNREDIKEILKYLRK